MEKDYTPIEIVDITIGNLSNISVPAGLTEQIAIPIAQNINNLRILKKKLEQPVDISVEPADDEDMKLGDLQIAEDQDGNA